MPQMQWNIPKLKHYNLNVGQALLSDEQTLVSYRQDFGKIFKSDPAAIFTPLATDVLQIFIQYAANNHLPVTIRGKGLSQGGQSLAVDGGIVVSMAYFNQVGEVEGDKIWADANASWSDVLSKTLPHHLAPYALPYNCNLSIAGVLSVGGVGAASFKQSFINTHVDALEIIDGTGQKHIVGADSPLYEACLGGQGRCGIITRARIDLKPVAPEVKTWFLVYKDQEQWLHDMEQARKTADYLELFCSPSIQGAGLFGDKRIPMAQWMYALHVSYEVDDKASPDIKDLKPWKVLHEQQESISSYYLRHNGRFEMMKLTGQWDLLHPWYECFTPAKVLRENLQDILDNLPLHYANLVHVVPIAKGQAGMTVMPEGEQFYELMILNPGITDALKDSCLQVVKDLDKRLLQKGGKRYLSGYLGEGLDEPYWKRHFGDRYQQWVDLKKQYDPQGIFTSCLFEASESFDR